MRRSLAEIEALSADGNVIPVYKEFLSDLETPITALLKLKAAAGKEPGGELFLLESVEVGEKLARFSFLGRSPVYTITARGAEIEITGHGRRAAGSRRFTGDALAELRAFMDRFRGVDDPALPPFTGGAVGYLCYDAVRLVEKIPASGRDDYHLPDFHFGLFSSCIVFDHLKHKLLLVANVLLDGQVSLEEAHRMALEQIDALERDLAAPLPVTLPGGEPPASAKAPAGAGSPAAAAVVRAFSSGPALSAAPPAWTSNFTQEGFEAAVEKCQEYIRAGDAFQVVPSQRFECRPGTDALSIYRALRSINPSPYMYYLDYGDFEVAGSSPETLVKVVDGRAETKPAAGTRPRGKTEAEDGALERELLADAKEVAEHVMLVDLGRNDLGRVSEFGTVRVKQMMGIERLSHVMHIVSIVEGRLRRDVHPLDALMSCLPAGTLSGAPKIRAMEIIDEIEPTRRGLYGGAICYMDFRGNLDSCIAIRTLLMKGEKAYVQAGAGVVADSRPELEYEETRHKAQALVSAVALAARMNSRD